MRTWHRDFSRGRRSPASQLVSAVEARPSTLAVSRGEADRAVVCSDDRCCIGAIGEETRDDSIEVRSTTCVGNVVASPRDVGERPEALGEAHRVVGTSR